MSRRFSPQSIALTLAAPLVAAVFGLGISSIALMITHNSPLETFRAMWDYGTQVGSLIEMVNLGAVYYIAALAVALTFKAGLFNIGVESQIRLGALFAAWIGAMFTLPPVLHVFVILVVASLVGAMWAFLPALLKVKRGVSEVISTIMLNSIGSALSAYLLADHFQQLVAGSNNVTTKPLPQSAWVPDLMSWLNRVGIKDVPGGGPYGLVFLAVALGFLYSFIVNRTRFGFDLRASGASPTAASVSGVNPKRMIILAMMLSGAFAGLAMMPVMLGESHAYTLGFRGGVGFTGIAIALLGRNNAVGIAFSSLLFGFLEVSARILELNGIATEIYIIMQGAILLSAVAAYEVVRRYRETLNARALARAGVTA
ncbi:MAG: ABC transporter permease [Candidatus Nanopelagicales bacterium]